MKVIVGGRVVNNCCKFVISVGRINAANACSGGMNVLNPDRRIIGIAKPTTPLMIPARNPIMKVKASKPGVFWNKSKNIAKLYHVL